MAENNPTTKNEAIISLLLGEIKPLMDKAEDIAGNFEMVNESLAQTRKEFNEDLSNLSIMIQKILKGQQTYQKDVENLMKLTALNKAQRIKTDGQVKKNKKSLNIIGSVLLFSLLLAGLTYTFFELYNTEKINTLRGKKLAEVWESLSENTQLEVSKALQK